MEKIVKRALEHFPICNDEKREHNELSPLRNCYINTAEEQQEIDIERACEIHCKLCESYHKCKETAWGYENTCDEREQIKKYIKGG